MKRSRIGLVMICLVLFFLVGCASKPPVVVTETVTEYVEIPSEWLETCPKSELEGTHNRDLWIGYQARGTDIDRCNAQLDAIGDYQEFNQSQD